MKRINVKKVKEELTGYNADNSMIDLIVNNIDFYNDMITKYKKGEKVNNYTIYQVNVQITKQLEMVRKASKTSSNGEPDTFTDLINQMKNNRDE